MTLRPEGVVEVVLVLARDIILDGRRDVWEDSHLAWYATRTGLSVEMTWIREEVW